MTDEELSALIDSAGYPYAVGVLIERLNETERELANLREQASR